MRQLRPWDVNPNPFKASKRSPLRDLQYIKDDAKCIRIDPAHTYAIDGIGKSYLASSIVVLMHMGAWGPGTTEVKLQNAYSRFMEFCRSNNKCTSIYEFSYKTLKLPQGSLLSWIVCLIGTWYCLSSPPIMKLNIYPLLPRLRAWPRGLGKGHDAAILWAWLDEEIRHVPPVEPKPNCMIGRCFGG